MIELQFTFATQISYLIVNNATIIFHKIPNEAFNLNLKSHHIHSFFYRNVVFPAQAEYSYFSSDFRLKIFLYYS